MQDPRPDLKYDSEEWSNLLKLSGKVLPDEITGILHGFRCAGLRLHKGRRGYVLRPDYDPKTSEWVTKAEYERDRDKWLMPWADSIVRVLQMLNEERREINDQSRVL